MARGCWIIGVFEDSLLGVPSDEFDGGYSTVLTFESKPTSAPFAGQRGTVGKATKPEPEPKPEEAARGGWHLFPPGTLFRGGQQPPEEAGTSFRECFHYERNTAKIEEEMLLDGLYVVHTNVPKEDMVSELVVESYKGLSVVERAFRSLKTMDLKIRPIYHRLEDRVRAHVFLCMLAYYVEWHLREKLAPLLFDDDDPEGKRARRSSPVAPAKRSARAERKASTQQTEDGWPTHSFQSLLKDLGTLCKNLVVLKAVRELLSDN